MKNKILLASIVVVMGSTSAFADNKIYRSRSGGSESARPIIVENKSDEAEKKNKDEIRAKPNYSELEKDASSSHKVIKKKVYASRTGSALAHPKIVIQDE